MVSKASVTMPLDGRWPIGASVREETEVLSQIQWDVDDIHVILFHMQ